MVRHRQIEVLVRIQQADRQPDARGRRRVAPRNEGCIAVAAQHGHGAGVGVGHRRVELAVPVEIPERHEHRPGADRNGERGNQGAVSTSGDHLHGARFLPRPPGPACRCRSAPRRPARWALPRHCTRGGEAAVPVPVKDGDQAWKPAPVARSRWPSPSRSPIARAMGRAPQGKSVRAPSVPSPFPSRTETVPAPKRSWFTVATSGFPSRFRSPITTTRGDGPVGYSTSGAKLPSPLPSSTDMWSLPRAFHSGPAGGCGSR